MPQASTSQPLILALDQGTTSSRAILFARDGTIHGVAQQEYTQHYPQPGWVEHDANDIWRTQLAVARAVLRENAVPADRLAAVGLTNQRETTVLWDRASGEPLHRAIVWQDRRTAGLCDSLSAAGHAETFRERTGLVVDAYFSGTKLKWLLDHIPGARARAERGELAFGTIDCWLAWKLSAGRVHVTDASNASRTLLFDIRRNCWDETLLALLDIPPAVLPQVVDSSGLVTTLDGALLGAEVPLAGIAGDQQAATFGQACFEPGMAKNTYGTGCFLLINTGQQAMNSRHRLLATIGWRRNEETTYLLEGSVFMGGAVVQWMRDGLGMISRSDEIEALASSVPDSGGIYLVPAHTGLGAPYWDPYARGALLGMTRGTTRAHVARAALEAIAFQSAEVLVAMELDCGERLRELRVDGGAAANDLLLQFQSDLLGVPVVRPRITETTALGAAYLAGLAVGFWRDEAELASLWQAERRFEPAMSADQRATLLDGWRRAVERSRHWAVAD
ncbi:MAG TPA: glycerol kinase GlpK [Candidatus Accumulibacter phosphatis]|nr:MAG: Glycerol kinase [Candidatus Accumulibacter sp. SK-11]HAY26428.1 glycerol kinase [Accumulibacter sp.]HCN69791.1 glycerol kinase [Accumulibacter sp.]HRL78431.1 glycerol kinase GlpK [Candidatus Accumulibacter phosphatis]HRQ97285.1 glycerol kinase GlpK [Candidatus Accumulibacter phosphatis]